MLIMYWDEIHMELAGLDFYAQNRYLGDGVDQIIPLLNCTTVHL